MQVIRTFEPQTVSRVGMNIRIMAIGDFQPHSLMEQRLAGMGGAVETMADLFTGLAAVIDDPAGYGLCVIDCDTCGGLNAGRRAQALMGEASLRVPVILISSECTIQEFPQERGRPLELRGPVSSLSLRIGFEHALRDRFMLQVS